MFLYSHKKFLFRETYFPLLLYSLFILERFRRIIMYFQCLFFKKRINGTLISAWVRDRNGLWMWSKTTSCTWTNELTWNDLISKLKKKQMELNFSSTLKFHSNFLVNKTCQINNRTFLFSRRVIFFLKFYFIRINGMLIRIRRK